MLDIIVLSWLTVATLTLWAVYKLAEYGYTNTTEERNTNAGSTLQLHDKS